MLSKTIEKALNAQITMEAYSSNIYLAMASWCEKQGLPGCASFLYDHTEEERVHMYKILKFINESGGHAIVDALERPDNDYDSIEMVFKTALDHERKVTKSIHNMAGLSFEEKDFATFNFLQWFVSEQIEEEALFTSVLDIIRISDEGKALLLIDKEVGELKTKLAAQKTQEAAK